MNLLIKSAFMLIILAFLSSCLSIGYKTGYHKAKKYYREDTIRVMVPAYSYGFMRGWRAYELDRARNIKKKLRDQ